MNCKPDQRAIVTRTLGSKRRTAYLGMIFTVRKVVAVTGFGPLWSVDHDNFHPVQWPLHGNKGEPITHVLDAMLTPLPDDPGPDETLTWPEMIEQSIPKPKEPTT